MQLVPLACLALGACGEPVTIHHRVAIRRPPAPVALEVPSALHVPTSCPVYAPGGGDIDTPEDPFPSGVAIICAVDHLGETYGLVSGDAPTAHVAVVPGGREIGLYFGFAEPEKGVLSAYDDLLGDGADIKLWASALDPRNPAACCSPVTPGPRLEVRAVAAGPQGLLISLGLFDSTSTLVTGSVAGASWWLQFHVYSP